MNPQGRMSASDRRWQQRYQTIQDRRERQRARRDASERYDEMEEVQRMRSVYEQLASSWRSDEWDRVITYTQSRTPDWFSNGGKWFVIDDLSCNAPTQPVDLKDDFESWDVSQIADFYCAFQE